MHLGGVDPEAVSNRLSKMANERPRDKKLNLRLCAIGKALSQNR